MTAVRARGGRGARHFFAEELQLYSFQLRELEAFTTTMLTQFGLGDLRVACGPMEINRPSRIQSMTHNHSRLLMPVAPLRHR